MTSCSSWLRDVSNILISRLFQGARTIKKSHRRCHGLQGDDASLASCRDCEWGIWFLPFVAPTMWLCDKSTQLPQDFNPMTDKSVTPATARTDALLPGTLHVPT
ncbi:protein of unknown function [Pseudomonas mediterranea]